MCVVNKQFQLLSERIGFGLYQSCGNRGSVRCMSVFRLQCCGWCRWGLGPGSGRVVLHLCVL